MILNIDELIQSNNDYAVITQILTDTLNNDDAILFVLNYKLENDLNKNKQILVDQVLNGLKNYE